LEDYYEFSLISHLEARLAVGIVEETKSNYSLSMRKKCCVENESINGKFLCFAMYCNREKISAGWLDDSTILCSSLYVT
jgi:hypothetical protein